MLRLRTLAERTSIPSTSYAVSFVGLTQRKGVSGTCCVRVSVPVGVRVCVKKVLSLHT